MTGSKHLILLLALIAAVPGCAAKQGGMALQPKVDDSINRPSSVRLQGGASIQQVLPPPVVAWQASQLYRQGAILINMQELRAAADSFHQAAGLYASIGDKRFQAQAVYAEGQMYRLLAQQPKAVKLFSLAAQLFQEADPTNPYLQACLAMGARVPRVAPVNPNKPLTAKVTKQETKPTHLVEALPMMANVVDRNLPLRGKISQLADGTKLDGKADDQVFRVGKALPGAAVVDVSDPFIKSTIQKAFAKMTCLETAALGGNLYTAPDLYSGFKAGGRTVVVGAADDLYSPGLKLKLNGQEFGVIMDLPGVSKGTKVVLPITDGEHVLAIDPRTGDTWKLMATPAKKRPEFNWWKLTHTKKG